ncbi:MAG: SusC/RagA family protein, partial [Pedobacter sp.]
MISFFSAAGIKHTCRKMLVPIGLLALCNSTAFAVISGENSSIVKLNNRLAAISGTVTDEKGQPLPGVSIYDKQTKRTTSTDGDGRFTIDVANGATLVFSFIGYETQEILVSGSKTINVKLKESNNTLNEVVA